MPRMKRHERFEWVLSWFGRDGHFSADAVNQEFHEDYHNKFPQYKRRETLWGAQPVDQAQYDLAEMYRSGLLERGRVSLGANWQPGFPKWVYGYTLPSREVTR